MNPPSLMQCLQWRNIDTELSAAEAQHSIGFGGHGTILFKADIKPDEYSILITDMSHCWFEQLTDEDIASRHKKLNPHVELPVSNLLSHLDSCMKPDAVSGIPSVKFSCREHNGQALLDVSFKVAKFPITWQFVGQPCEPEYTRDNLTVPLLLMVKEQQRIQQQLVRIISDKQKEIQDYRQQGFSLSRKNLRTKDFYENEFMKAQSTSKDFDKCVKVNANHISMSEPELSLYCEIMEKFSQLQESSPGVTPVSSPEKPTGRQTNLNEDVNQPGACQAAAAADPVDTETEKELVRRNELLKRTSDSKRNKTKQKMKKLF